MCLRAQFDASMGQGGQNHVGLTVSLGLGDIRALNLVLVTWWDVRSLSAQPANDQGS